MGQATLGRCVYTKGYTLMVQEYHQGMGQQYNDHCHSVQCCVEAVRERQTDLARSAIKLPTERVSEVESVADLQLAI